MRSGPGTRARLPSPASLVWIRNAQQSVTLALLPVGRRQENIGTMDQIAVLLAPGHVPDQLGGSYEDACAALDLPPIPAAMPSASLTR